MKAYLLFAALAAVLSVPLAQAQAPAKTNQNGAQTPVKKNPLVPYAGNWSCSLDSRPWFLLNLNLAGEQFSGSLQRARSFQLNDNGEVKQVSEEFFTLQLTDAKLNPDGLLMSFREPESQQTQRYQMKLTGDTSAEVRMLEMILPPGMPKAKPWKLVRAAAPAMPTR